MRTLEVLGDADSRSPALRLLGILGLGKGGEDGMVAEGMVLIRWLGGWI